MPGEAAALLRELKLVLTVPVGCVLLSPTKNPHWSYLFAIRSADGEVECRYDARQLKRFLNERAAYQIERLTADGWQILPIGWAIPDAAADECCTGETGCDQTGPGPRVFGRVAPGSSVTLEWDARERILSEESYTCPAWGPIEFRWGGLQPVGPGEYRVTVGFEQELPSNCSMDEPDVARCANGFVMPSDSLLLCGTTGEATSVLSLPDAGDITVTVMLP